MICGVISVITNTEELSSVATEGQVDKGYSWACIISNPLPAEIFSLIEPATSVGSMASLPSLFEFTEGFEVLLNICWYLSPRQQSRKPLRTPCLSESPSSGPHQAHLFQGAAKVISPLSLHLSLDIIMFYSLTFVLLFFLHTKSDSSSFS